MTYNELIDALLDIARCANNVTHSANFLKLADPRVAPEHMKIPLDMHTNLCDALGALEALPYPFQDPKPGFQRAAEFIRDFRLARDTRKAAEASAMEWMCTSCRTVYPGPPGKGFNCVSCPDCGGTTAPRLDTELREARHDLAKLHDAMCSVQNSSRDQIQEMQAVLLNAGYSYTTADRKWVAPLHLLANDREAELREAKAEIERLRKTAEFGKLGHKSSDPEYIALRQKLEAFTTAPLDANELEALLQSSKGSKPVPVLVSGREAELQEKLTTAQLALQAVGYTWQPRLNCWQAPSESVMLDVAPESPVEIEIRAALKDARLAKGPGRIQFVSNDAIELRLNIADQANWLQITKAQLNRAERALRRAGYEDRGGEEWVPPLGIAHPGGVRPAAPRPAPPPAKAPCADCGAPFHKYTECPPFSGLPPESEGETSSEPWPFPNPNVPLDEQPGLRGRMFDKLAGVRVGGDTASAKFLIKYVGGSDKLADVPADKWQTVIDACDEYVKLRGRRAL